MEKYKSYGTLSKTTHFLSVFCEVDVVQQCTEAQAGMVLDGLNKAKLSPETFWQGPCSRRLGEGDYIFKFLMLHSHPQIDFTLR